MVQSSRENFYELLGVSEFASLGAIKRAYRNRIKELHPDVTPEANVTSDEFLAVSEAYYVLSRREARNKYDAAMGLGRKGRTWSALVWLALAFSASVPAVAVLVLTGAIDFHALQNKEVAPTSLAESISDGQGTGPGAQQSRSVELAAKSQDPADQAREPPVRADALDSPVAPVRSPSRALSESGPPDTVAQNLGPADLDSERSPVQLEGPIKQAAPGKVRTPDRPRDPGSGQDFEALHADLPSTIASAANDRDANGQAVSPDALPVAPRRPSDLEFEVAQRPRAAQMLDQQVLLGSRLRPGPGGDDGLQSQLREFIQIKYLASREDADRLNRLYCPTVRYYGEQRDRAAVIQAVNAYQQRWPQRSYQLRPETLEISSEGDPTAVSVSFVFDYTVARKKQIASGVGAAKLALRITGGRWQICSEASEVIERNPGLRDGEPSPDRTRQLNAAATCELPAEYWPSKPPWCVGQ